MASNLSLEPEQPPPWMLIVLICLILLTIGVLGAIGPGFLE